MCSSTTCGHVFASSVFIYAKQRSLALYSYIHKYLLPYVRAHTHARYRGSRLKTAKASGNVTASRTEPAVSFASKSNRAGRVRNYASSESSEGSSTVGRAWAPDGALVPSSNIKLNGLNYLSASKAASRVTFASSETEASHLEGSSNFEVPPILAAGPRTMSYEQTRMIGNQQAPPMTPGLQSCLQNTPLVAPEGQVTGPRTHRTTSYERMIGNQRAPPMTPGRSMDKTQAT
jgi:hypothetical protein